MACNHAKINDSDWSDAANFDAADAGVASFSTLAFRRSTLAAHKCEKRVYTI